jgi:polyisoprenoid-binding protein YceI
MRRTLLILLAVLVLAVAGFAQSGTWQIDPAHSAAQFSVRHMMISNVKGAFTKVSGTVQYDPANLTRTAVEATIDAASVDTRVEARDKDLRSTNFFDVEKYPTLAFKSKRAEVAGGKLRLVGDLTMHGVTKEVVLQVDDITQPVKDAGGNLHVGATATTKVNRKDFGLMWNHMIEGGGAVVGDEVSITLDVELIKRAPAAK